MKEITVTAVLTGDEALALAQFLKRARLDSYQALAQTDDEAYQMQQAGEKIRQALASQGYAPR